MVGAGLGQRIQQRRRKYTYDDTRSPFFSPSFLWKERPRWGGGWPRVTILPHSGKPTPPRFARLPLPEEGARMIFKETLIQSLSFAVRDSRFPPHMPRCSAFLICRSYRQCPIRPCGVPSPRGEGCDTRIPSSKKAAKPPPSFLIPHSPLYLIPQNRSVFSFAHFVSTSSETPIYCASALAT